MTDLPPEPSRPSRRRKRRGSFIPMAVSFVIAGAAIAAVAYLLWPTWHKSTNTGPDRFPVSVGGTFFNVPSFAFRRSVQKHSGPQESVDLQYQYPSLSAVEHRSANAETFDLNTLKIDRILLTISAHNDAMSPDERLNTIYPLYINEALINQHDGLTTKPFRDGSPYENESLMIGDSPALAAICTRDGDTPGMCNSTRRVNGADLTFRFPRAWLRQWRQVAESMDHLTAQLSGLRR